MVMNGSVELERAATRLRAASLRFDALGDKESLEAIVAAREQYNQALAKAKAPSEVQQGAATPTLGRGEKMGAETTGLEARVSIRMENVPTSMAHVLARGSLEMPLVTVDVENTREKKARVSVRCWVEGFSATQVRSAEIARNKTETFKLFPAFFSDKVKALTEMCVAALHVQVKDLDTDLVESEASYAIPLLAASTAVLVQRDPSTNQELDLTPLLAAWVTPNSPEILTFLRTCADFSKLKAMLGYQIDADGIREHVRAIYDALKAAGIVYVNSPVAFGNATNQFIQRVRLPRESLAQRSANCIDGTVLMASLLEATGLSPGIVLIPGHAYLAFRPQSDSTTWEFVETTMIGTETFDRACQAARATTVRSSDANELKLIDVGALRVAGIAPME